MASPNIVIATGNAGKLGEFERLFAKFGIDICAQSQFDVPEAIEDGQSFVENAILKARNACLHTGLPAIADDSGLEVDALNGQPGIFSARFSSGPFGDAADDDSNNRKLLDLLRDTVDDQRGARFVCALVYLRHADDPAPLIGMGFWPGRILHEPRGERGFGYDPLFYVEDQGCSSAELDRDLKNRISHRAQATKNLLQQMQEFGLLVAR